jgi:hypothetical protein
MVAMGKQQKYPDNPTIINKANFGCITNKQKLIFNNFTSMLTNMFLSKI